MTSIIWIGEDKDFQINKAYQYANLNNDLFTIEDLLIIPYYKKPMYSLNIKLPKGRVVYFLNDLTIITGVDITHEMVAKYRQ